MRRHAAPDYSALNQRYGVRFAPQDIEDVQPQPSDCIIARCGCCGARCRQCDELGLSAQVDVIGGRRP